MVKSRMDKLESLNVGGYGKDKKFKSFFSNSSKNGGYRNILALEDFILHHYQMSVPLARERMELRGELICSMRATVFELICNGTDCSVD